jgi:hypothetical protein
VAWVTLHQQRPVEITIWAVLIYFFGKLFFVVLCHVGAVVFSPSF